MPRRLLQYMDDVDVVVWDWNGTLLDDMAAVRLAEARHFAHYGMSAPTQETRDKLFCFPVRLYYERLGFDFERHPYDEVHAHFMKLYEEHLALAPLFGGTSELLAEIGARGKKQFVLTAAPQSHVESALRERGIAPHFAAVYGLPTSRADSKIERDRELVREHALRPERTLLVGDTEHDHEVAEALGLKSLLVADGHHPYERLVARGARVLRSRYGDLL